MQLAQACQLRDRRWKFGQAIVSDTKLNEIPHDLNISENTFKLFPEVVTARPRPAGSSDSLLWAEVEHPKLAEIPDTF
ncbi:hypothetical protein [Bradyrhizobium sp. BWA-3-5]|uniref:hypothetical protein n=1 Tax=Bradyrhizobium sp. BWA-3-5 TaxID=3080013 RepID=UPI00293EB84E|nr:hypothetical protein [Bradyrhizobium sp. BWA-3-5]WOH69580.1 hypothetical protein RX331_18580 [Bradyrhizobium sp. BWA-3-5]